METLTPNFRKLLNVLCRGSENAVVRNAAEKYCNFMSYAILNCQSGVALPIHHLEQINKRTNLSLNEQFSVAMRAIFQRRFSIAKEYLELAIETGNHNPEIILAYVLLKINQDSTTGCARAYVDDINKVQRYIKDSEGSVLCFCYFLKAEISLQVGDIAFAIKYYRRAAFLTDKPEQIFKTMKDLYGRLRMSRVQKFYERKSNVLEFKQTA